MMRAARDQFGEQGLIRMLAAAELVDEVEAETED